MATSFNPSEALERNLPFDHVCTRNIGETGQLSVPGTARTALSMLSALQTPQKPIRSLNKLLVNEGAVG